MTPAEEYARSRGATPEEARDFARYVEGRDDPWPYAFILWQALRSPVFVVNKT